MGQISCTISFSRRVFCGDGGLKQRGAYFILPLLGVEGLRMQLSAQRLNLLIFHSSSAS